jgi:hypothetical protein
MSESVKDEPLHKNSPSGIFNDLAKSAIERNRDIPISVVGVMDENEKNVVQDFLARPETQDFLGRIKGNKSYQGLGIITEITQVGSQTQVFYTDQWGMPLGFVYDPTSSLFSEAPNGFRVGDVILNKSQGIDIENIKPVKFPPKTEKKVVRRFLQIFEKRKRVMVASGKKLPKKIGEEEKEE